MRVLLSAVLALLLTLTLLLTGCYAGDWSDDVYLEQLTLGDPLALAEEGRVYTQKTMPIQIARIIAAGYPTRVEVGIFQGFSLPIGGANEELFACQCVPADWDGNTMYLYVGGWVDTANTDKNFQLRLSHDHWTAGDVVPNSPTDVDVETATGTAVQYTTYKIQFVIVPGDITVGDALGIKLVRIAASADEIAGEFVVEGMVLVYRVDSLGGTTP